MTLQACIELRKLSINAGGPGSGRHPGGANEGSGYSGKSQRIAMKQRAAELGFKRVGSGAGDGGPTSVKDTYQHSATGHTLTVSSNELKNDPNRGGTNWTLRDKGGKHLASDDLPRNTRESHQHAAEIAQHLK